MTFLHHTQPMELQLQSTSFGEKNCPHPLTAQTLLRVILRCFCIPKSATLSGHCNEVSFYLIISGMLCRRLPKVGEFALALYRAPRTLLVRRINFLLKFVTSQIRHATLLLWGDYPNLPNFKRWCNEKYLS